MRLAKLVNALPCLVLDHLLEALSALLYLRLELALLLHLFFFLGPLSVDPALDLVLPGEVPIEERTALTVLVSEVLARSYNRWLERALFEFFELFFEFGLQDLGFFGLVARQSRSVEVFGYGQRTTAACFGKRFQSPRRCLFPQEWSRLLLDFTRPVGPLLTVPLVLLDALGKALLLLFFVLAQSINNLGHLFAHLNQVLVFWQFLGGDVD